MNRPDVDFIKTTGVAVIGAFIAAGALAAATVGTASTASADTGGYSNSDALYYQDLTTGEDAITVSNFPLLVDQGREACQRMAEGASTQDAIYALMAEGPYSFDTANSIVSSAGVTYCLSDISRAGQVDFDRLHQN
jgi:Protein of unknown function (DUF732)